MAWKPKYAPDPPKRRRRSIDPLVGFAVVVAIVVGAVGLDWLVRDLSEDSVRAQLPRIIRPTGHRGAADLTVVDGDTVRSGGTIYRLVGFDAPERGDRALCDSERQLAERASQRLRSLLQTGEPQT